MIYLVMVSHGTFAKGAHSVIDMMAGSNRPDVISVGLEKEMCSNEFEKLFEKKTSHIKESDTILLFADIIGGSPLTTSTLNLSQRGFKDNLRTFSGLNIASILNAVLLKDSTELNELAINIVEEGKESVSILNFDTNYDGDEEDI